VRFVLHCPMRAVTRSDLDGHARAVIVATLERDA
jgi:hypothetical protein